MARPLDVKNDASFHIKAKKLLQNFYIRRLTLLGLTWKTHLCTRDSFTLLIAYDRRAYVEKNVFFY